MPSLKLRQTGKRASLKHPGGEEGKKAGYASELRAEAFFLSRFFAYFFINGKSMSPSGLSEKEF